MTVLAKPRMTVDEYLAWAEEHPGRYELYRGEVFAMPPETSGHAETKFAIQSALLAALRRKRAPCHLLPDGMTVRIDAETAYEPDALVYCGEKLPSSVVEVPKPMIVVEVLSPSTRRVDMSRKLAGYFRLPSIVHYLVFEIEKCLVIHHARGTGDTILTRIITEGSVSLDPPGIELAMSDIYAP